MLIVTHNIEVQIGVDFSPMLNPNNINGVLLTLGCRDEDIVESFSNKIVTEIESILSKYVNVSVGLASVKPVIEISDSTPNPIVSEIENQLFNIKANMGILDSIIVNSEELNKIISKDFQIPYDKIIYRTDLQDNYIIRFVDVDGRIQEIGG